MRRAVSKLKPIHIADYQLEQAYVDRDPVAVATAEVGRARTILAVPMVGEARALGVFFLYRQEVWCFSKRQIALLQNFAAQAVIAIENARLFNEVQAKTHDLEQSLQQQTATADVLKVISRSAFDLQAVLHTLVESAARLTSHIMERERRSPASRLPCNETSTPMPASLNCFLKRLAERCST